MALEILVLSIGIINPSTGKTGVEWNLFDHPEMLVYLTDDGYLIYASNGSLPVDTVVILRNNDSRRRIKDSTIIDFCLRNRGDLLEMLMNNGYNYYPAKPFTKKPKTDRLITSYSLKGFS